MAMTEVDLEKQPFVTAEELPSPSSSASKDAKRDSLYIYQTLVGDISAPPSPHDDSLYHELIARERKAKIWFILTALLFGTLVAAQIVLCLGIAIGAQVGIGKNTISILAGVNTGVAATIAVLKGLGLPEKKAIERHKLMKISENIRYTTRRIKAGLAVDAEQEAEAALKADQDAEDEAQVLANVGDAAAAVPGKGDSTKAM